MIRILDPGFYTSVQDRGRPGYRDLGIPVAGSMDQGSAGVANSLLGNEPDDALLETTVKGPRLEFTRETWVVVTGATLPVLLNGNLFSMNKPFQVCPGDILSLGKISEGARTYIAVSGGIKTPVILGSRSFSRGVTPWDILEEGDELPFDEADLSPFNAEHHWRPVGIDRYVLEAYKGPEFNLLEEKQIEKLAGQLFTVSAKVSRMGYRLNESLATNSHSIITSAVLPGTVQYTPGGDLIILMRDCQTTGGYPRILQLSGQATDLLAQKRPKDIIRFKLL